MEVYVCRDAFVPYLADVRRDFLEHEVDTTYGTIRFIQRDVDSFLPRAVEWESFVDFRPAKIEIAGLRLLNTHLEGVKVALR